MNGQTLRRQRIALIFGGRSEEHEVSLVSARSVARALDRSRYQVVPCAISREGHWLPLARGRQALRQPEVVALEVGAEGRSPALSLREALRSLAQVDVAFPLVHGRFGEDGALQGMLELLDLPYVGAGVLGSALGMDKPVQKALLRAQGLPVVDHLAVERHRWHQEPEAVVEELEARFSYPIFVKPARSGSSIGVTKAHDREGLTLALEVAAQLDTTLLAEEAVEGREIEVSVLGWLEPQASLPGEVIPAREFYDYEAKYNDPRTQLVVPVSLGAEMETEAQRLAVRAFQALQGSGMARVDLFLERCTGRLLINEINTIPGFTAVSMYPKLWEASGLPYAALLEQLIALAQKRHRERRPVPWTPPWPRGSQQL